MGMEEAMSTVRGIALPAPTAAFDQQLSKPAAIVARILRSIHSLSQRSRVVSARPDRHPPVPTFFPFDVRDLIAQGCARERADRR